MTARNAICSGCGEQVLIEDNGQKDGFCSCDPVCLKCGCRFKPWEMEGIAGIVGIEREICEECLDAAMKETAERLWYWLFDALDVAPSLRQDVRYNRARHSALVLFRLDVYARLAREN
ncbi:MAG: hypothetical protein Q8Q12_00560 [bacterium]|nr:hypothetical protein [bacterium]